LAALDALKVVSSPVIDVGSGGGFPGLPMKIARPELEVTLLEATAKKARFLEEMVAELALEGARVVHGRAEEVAHDPAHREGYRLAVARAVAPLRVLAEYALPFVAVGGVLAAPKGSAAPREIREAGAAIDTLGGEIETVQPLDVPGPPQTLIIVRKRRETPAKYPRRPGMPAKRPL
jgi:16S rRNA (guanine527-N7)-methyltransferase